MRTGSGQTGSQAGGSMMMTPSALAPSGDATIDTRKVNAIRDRIGIRRIAVSSPGQATLAAAWVRDAATLVRVPVGRKSGGRLKTGLRGRVALDHVREFLGSGDDGEVEVGAGTGREDRGVDDAQTVYSVDARVVVDDRHRIRRGSHTAAARGMKRRADARAGPGRELGGISPGRRLFGIRREDALHRSRGDDPFDKV